MANPTCHYCDRPAEERCPTCGRLYCAEHGEDLCLRCLSPESATPSLLAYRGALAALVVGTLVAVFLWLSPPESKSSDDVGRPIGTATAGIGATATPTRQGGATRTATATAGTATATAATATATGTSATPSPSATTTPQARTHTVASGDSLFVIAERYNTTVAAIVAANAGMTENTPLQIGQVINLPPQ